MDKIDRLRIIKKCLEAVSALKGSATTRKAIESIQTRHPGLDSAIVSVKSTPNANRASVCRCLCRHSGYS